MKLNSFVLAYFLGMSCVFSSFQSSNEQAATFFTVIDTNINSRVFPNLPPNSPEGSYLELKPKIPKPKRFKTLIVYYDNDWELPWLLFLKDALDSAYDILPQCHIERREGYPRYRAVIE